MNLDVSTAGQTLPQLNFSCLVMLHRFTACAGVRSGACHSASTTCSAMLTWTPSPRSRQRQRVVALPPMAEGCSCRLQVQPCPGAAACRLVANIAVAVTLRRGCRKIETACTAADHRMLVACARQFSDTDRLMSWLNSPVRRTTSVDAVQGLRARQRGPS